MNLNLMLCLILLSFCAAEAREDSVSVILSYPASLAGSVAVAGSFNNWDPEGYSFTRKDTQWVLELRLPAGYYYYKLVTDGKWIYDPSNPERVNDGGSGYNSILKAGNPKPPVRRKSSVQFPREKLPVPILADQAFVDLYYTAWEMAWNKISYGNSENGFERQYMDEGFNELIYQWDTNFITAFAMYAADVFPVMPSLDNFYNKQRSDGYIQRVYWETTGKIANEPTPDEPMVNPPLFAWLELRYYKMTGDSSRLKRVLPVLTKYFYWIEGNLRNTSGKGLYYNTPLGSGMDNTPRPGVGKAGWIDFSGQQALAARCIASIAELTGDTHIAREFAENYHRISSLVNTLCWNKSTGFYYDTREDGTLSSVKHIGAYWTLLSGICPAGSFNAFSSHLKNPNEFYRSHLVPTLSADDPAYEPDGHYWLGSVWAPTNYMVVKGLEEYGDHALADEIALNHITNMSSIFKGFKYDENRVAYEERYADGYRTIWECYAPDKLEPGTRWDDTFYSRQDFVGWSGLGPIAMLIENVLGIDTRGDLNRIRWRIHRSDRHGVENLSFRDGKVSLIFEAGKYGPEVTVRADNEFLLTIEYLGRHYSKRIPKGELKFKL